MDTLMIKFFAEKPCNNKTKGGNKRYGITKYGHYYV